MKPGDVVVCVDPAAELEAAGLYEVAERPFATLGGMMVSVAHPAFIEPVVFYTRRFRVVGSVR